MGMLDAFNLPNPIDDIEPPHDDETDPDARVTAEQTAEDEPPARELDEPGAADRTPRP